MLFPDADDEWDLVPALDRVRAQDPALAPALAPDLDLVLALVVELDPALALDLADAPDIEQDTIEPVVIDN